MRRGHLYLAGLAFFFPLVGYSQVHSEPGESKMEGEHEFKPHRIAIMIGHAHVPKGSQISGEDQTLIIPTWGLNYEYWFNEKWGVGMHTDMEITTYVIESGSNAELERERPVILSLVGIYKTDIGLLIGGGIGREFEKNENFWVYRFGLEYEFELGNHWDIVPALNYDIKESIYDSWTIGLAVGNDYNSIT